MSDLLDAIIKASKAGCRVGKVLNDPEVGEQLREAINLQAQKRVTFVAISDVFTDAGYDIRPDNLSKHARGRCGCNG